MQPRASSGAEDRTSAGRLNHPNNSTWHQFWRGQPGGLRRAASERVDIDYCAFLLGYRAAPRTEGHGTVGGHHERITNAVGRGGSRRNDFGRRSGRDGGGDDADGTGQRRGDGAVGKRSQRRRKHHAGDDGSRGYVRPAVLRHLARGRADVRSSPEDPAELATWYPETAAPIVAELREYAPAEIADAVNTFMDGTEQFATSGDSMALFSPEMSAAVTTIYPSLADGCGITVVSALLTDYDFGGVPETLSTGPTAFVILNDSEEGEAHEMVVMRLNDEVDLTIDELLAYPEDELDQFATFVNEVETPGPDAASGMVIDLTPGRYLYACYVTKGSVDGAEGTGPPHATEGMGGEFTVA